MRGLTINQCGYTLVSMRGRKTASIREAPTVRVPEDLLTEVAAEIKRAFPSLDLSRIQSVSFALRDWLDGRKGRASKPK